jgi:hypothetical protein
MIRGKLRPLVEKLVLDSRHRHQIILKFTRIALY